MPSGKEIASFDLKSSGISVLARPGGARGFDINMQGAVKGAWDATVLASMHMETGNFEVGTYTITVAAYLKDGSVVTGEGAGVFKALGGHRWALSGQDVTSDGHVLSTHGEIDLASMSYKGKVFE